MKILKKIMKNFHTLKIKDFQALKNFPEKKFFVQQIPLKNLLVVQLLKSSPAFAIGERVELWA